MTKETELKKLAEQMAKHVGSFEDIENFWNQAKRHLRKFNGVPKEHFYLY